MRGQLVLFVGYLGLIEWRQLEVVVGGLGAAAAADGRVEVNRRQL